MKKQSRKMNAINPPAGAVGDVQARIDRFFLMIAVFWTIVILSGCWIALSGGIFVCHGNRAGRTLAQLQQGTGFP